VSILKEPYFFFTYRAVKNTRGLVPGKPFQPCLVFVSKISEKNFLAACLLDELLVLIENIRLSLRGASGNNQGALMGENLKGFLAEFSTLK
jgi:hypothetical protein